MENLHITQHNQNHLDFNLEMLAKKVKNKNVKIKRLG